MTKDEQIAELEQRIEVLKAHNAAMRRALTEPPPNGAIPVLIPRKRWDYLEREMGMGWIEKWLLGGKYQPPPSPYVFEGEGDELSF